MTNLEVIRPFIERFITAVSNSLRLEMAIFDGSCQLFYCTPTYSVKVKSFAPRQIQRRSFAALAITLSRKIF